MILSAVLALAFAPRGSPVETAENTYFYKTQNGSRIGDLFMELIPSCQLAKANPFEYLTALQQNFRAAQRAPERWRPWNYEETLAGAGPS